MPVVVGIDSSTQSTKVEARDVDTGEVLARGSAPHPPVTPPTAEQHPDAWWDALVSACEALRPWPSASPTCWHGPAGSSCRTTTSPSG